MKKQPFVVEVSEEVLMQGIRISGAKSGKTLAVTAGVHGCEYVGIQAIKELMREIDPQELSGDLILLPLINENGFYEGAKQIVPEDGENLNRCFPGDSNKSITYRIAKALEEQLYPEIDFLMDLHGGDVQESMVPLVFFPTDASEEIKKVSDQAAKSLSLTYRVRSTAKNGLYSYAVQCGIPALLVERGGAGKWSEEEVCACKKNVREMMNFLGICTHQEKSDSSCEIVQAVYEEAESSGFWYCMKKAGERIQQGELLGRIEDIEGRILQECRSQFDGVVLYHTHALGVKKQDPLIAYGRQSF